MPASIGFTSSCKGQRLSGSACLPCRWLRIWSMSLFRELRSWEQRFGEPGAAAVSPILIKRLDNVQLILNIGDIQVSGAAAKRLQDGRAGERISVRNVDSSRVVHGRVVNRTVVEIDFDPEQAMNRWILALVLVCCLVTSASHADFNLGSACSYGSATIFSSIPAPPPRRRPGHHRHRREHGDR